MPECSIRKRKQKMPQVSKDIVVTKDGKFLIPETFSDSPKVENIFVFVATPGNA